MNDLIGKSRFTIEGGDTLLQSQEESSSVSWQKRHEEWKSQSQTQSNNSRNETIFWNEQNHYPLTSSVDGEGNEQEYQDDEGQELSHEMSQEYKEEQDATAIVRSIASYLSLSEAESIGSLYSLMNHSHGQLGGSFSVSSNATPRSVYSRGRMSTPQPFHSGFASNGSMRRNNSLVSGSGLGMGLGLGLGHELDMMKEDGDGSSNSGGSSCAAMDNHSSVDQGTGDVSVGVESSISGADAAAGYGPPLSYLSPGSHPNHHRGRRAPPNVIEEDEGDHLVDLQQSMPLSWAAVTASPRNRTRGPVNAGDDGRGANHNHDQDDDFSPPTPGLVALSPIPLDQDYDHPSEDSALIADETRINRIPQEQIQEENDAQELRGRRRKMVQEKLISAVLSHPHSIRSYCLSAQKAKGKIQRKRRRMEMHMQSKINSSSFHTLCSCCHKLVTFHNNQCQEQTHEPTIHPSMGIIPIEEEDEYHKLNTNTNTSTIKIEQYCSCVHPVTKPTLETTVTTRKKVRQWAFNLFFNKLLQNVPLSILLDLAQNVFHLNLNVVLATTSLSITSLQSLLSALSSFVHNIWDFLSSSSSNFTPFKIIEIMLQLQKNAMGRTSEAIVTGIQSVATGVGSARSAALSHFSRNGGVVSTMTGGGIGHGGRHSVNKLHHDFTNSIQNSSSVRDSIINEKMFRKLNKIDSTAKVISYLEREDEVLTEHAKKRVQRMMHYSVSLRPFVATIAVPTNGIPVDPFGNIDFPPKNQNINNRRYQRTTNTNNSSSSFVEEGSIGYGESSSDSGSSMISSNDSISDTNSPFMCTPKSFPPTPSSRAQVMAEGTRFAEDVVFLARDHLRVNGGLQSSNAQTRAMAEALRDGSRLAVFNANDPFKGILFTCGYHCASKRGNHLYCSARGMIPVLRSCYVYFEMSVSTPPLLEMMLHHASLSIGLSTLEMPLNALVGAWKGSVGLCSTGQILASSQWISPVDQRTYGSNSTVGCLVYLDDESAFETWDGVMVPAYVTFNVNGHVLTPALTTAAESLQKMTNEDRDHESLNSDSMDDSPSHKRPSSILPIFVPREEELFPTVTLHSSETEVMCRFCAADILATSREEIGAPTSGIPIYTIDGSVLFDDDMEASDQNVEDDEDDNMTLASLESLNDVEFE